MWKSPRQAILETLRERHWTACLFGGAVRDIMTHSAWVVSRDIDVVVAGADDEQLQCKFAQHVQRRTRLGGFHLGVQGWRFDIWPLEKTWAFQELPVLLQRDIATLPRTTFLTTEAIVVELSSTSGKPRAVYEHGFFESIVNRTVELNLEVNPYQALNIIRAFVAARRLKFQIGPKLVGHIARQMRSISIEELFEEQMCHYHRPLFSLEELSIGVKQIKDAARWRQRCALMLPMFVQLDLPVTSDIELDLDNELDWDSDEPESTPWDDCLGQYKSSCYV